MYKFITCPKTGNIHTVSSKNGKKIIMDYADFILKQSGGASPIEKEITPEISKIRQSIINELFTKNYNRGYREKLLKIINIIDQFPNDINKIISNIDFIISEIASKEKLRQVTSSRHFYMTAMTDLYDKINNENNMVQEIANTETVEIAEKTETDTETLVNPYIEKPNIDIQRPGDTSGDTPGDSSEVSITERDKALITEAIQKYPRVNEKVLYAVVSGLYELFPGVLEKDDAFKKKFLYSYIKLIVPDTDFPTEPRLTNKFDTGINTAMPPPILVGGAGVDPGDEEEARVKVVEMLTFALTMYRFISRRSEPAHDFPSFRSLIESLKDILIKKDGNKILGGFNKLKLPRNPIKCVDINPLRLNERSLTKETIKVKIMDFLKNTFKDKGVSQASPGSQWKVREEGIIGAVGWCDLDCIAGAFKKVFCDDIPISINNAGINFNDEKFNFKSELQFSLYNPALSMLKPSGNEHEGPTFNYLHNNPYISEGGALFDAEDPSHLRKFYSQFNYFIDYGVTEQLSIIVFLSDKITEIYSIKKMLTRDVKSKKDETRRKALSGLITDKLKNILNNSNIVNYTMDCVLAGSLSRSSLTKRAAKKIWGKDASAGDSLYALTSTLRNSKCLNHIVPVTNSWDPASSSSTLDESKTLGKGIQLKGDNAILFDSLRESSRRIFFIDSIERNNKNEIHIWYNVKRYDWFNISPEYLTDKVKKNYRIFDESYKSWPTLNLKSAQGQDFLKGRTQTDAKYIGYIHKCPGVDNLILLRYLIHLYFKEHYIWLAREKKISIGTTLYKWVRDLMTFTVDDQQNILVKQKKKKYKSKKKVLGAIAKAVGSKNNTTPLDTLGASEANKYINEHVNQYLDDSGGITMAFTSPSDKPSGRIRDSPDIRPHRLESWNVVYAFMIQSAGGKLQYDRTQGEDFLNVEYFKNDQDWPTKYVPESHADYNNGDRGANFVFLKLISTYIADGISKIPPPSADLSKYEDCLRELEKSADLFILDIKKSGDYSQVKLDRLLNMLNHNRQTIHIVNDRLAALAAITNETHVMAAGKIIEYNKDFNNIQTDIAEQKGLSVEIRGNFSKLANKNGGVIFGGQEYQNKNEYNRYTSLVVYTSNRSAENSYADNNNIISSVKIDVTNAYIEKMRISAAAPPSTNSFMTWVKGTEHSLPVGGAVIPDDNTNIKERSKKGIRRRARMAKEPELGALTEDERGVKITEIHVEVEEAEKAKEEVAAEVVSNKKAVCKLVASNELREFIKNESGIDDGTSARITAIQVFGKANGAISMWNEIKREGGSGDTPLRRSKRKENIKIAKIESLLKIIGDGVEQLLDTKIINGGIKQRYLSGIKKKIVDTSENISNWVGRLRPRGTAQPAYQMGGASKEPAGHAYGFNKLFNESSELLKAVCAHTHRTGGKIRRRLDVADTGLTEWVEVNNNLIGLELKDFLNMITVTFSGDIKELQKFGRSGPRLDMVVEELNKILNPENSGPPRPPSDSTKVKTAFTQAADATTLYESATISNLSDKRIDLEEPFENLKTQLKFEFLSTVFNILTVIFVKAEITHFNEHMIYCLNQLLKGVGNLANKITVMFSDKTTDMDKAIVNNASQFYQGTSNISDAVLIPNNWRHKKATNMDITSAEYNYFVYRHEEFDALDLGVEWGNDDDWVLVTKNPGEWERTDGDLFKDKAIYLYTDNDKINEIFNTINSNIIILDEFEGSLNNIIAILTQLIVKDFTDDLDEPGHIARIKGGLRELLGKFVSASKALSPYINDISYSYHNDNITNIDIFGKIREHVLVRVEKLPEGGAEFGNILPFSGPEEIGTILEILWNILPVLDTSVDYSNIVIIYIFDNLLADGSGRRDVILNNINKIEGYFNRIDELMLDDEFKEDLMELKWTSDTYTIKHALLKKIITRNFDIDREFKLTRGDLIDFDSKVAEVLEAVEVETAEQEHDAAPAETAIDEPGEQLNELLKKEIIKINANNVGIITYIQGEIQDRLDSLPRTAPLTVEATSSPEDEINTSEITLGCVLGYCYIHRSFEEMVKNKAAQDAEYAVALSDSSAWAADTASDDDEGAAAKKP